MGYWDFLLDIILGWIGYIWNAIKGFVTSLISSMLGWINSFWSSLTNFLMWISTQINSALSTFGATVWGWISTAISSINQWFANTWSSLTKFTSWITSNIWSWLNTAWSSFTSFLGWISIEISAAIGTFSTVVTGLIAAAVKGANDWINGLGKQWSDFTYGLGIVWNKVIGEIHIESSKQWQEENTKGTQPGGLIYNGIAGALAGIMDTFGSTIGETPEESADRYKQGEKPNWEDVDTSTYHW